MKYNTIIKKYYNKILYNKKMKIQNICEIQ